jgi:CheY-like chemotaxis protein
VAGFTVIEASGADEALSYFRGGGSVDLVFSDIYMPGSMTGLELARHIREAHPIFPSF